MLDNEITTGQTSDAAASQTAENPESSQTAAEVNDTAFEDSGAKETSSESNSNSVKVEATEEKPKQTIIRISRISAAFTGNPSFVLCLSHYAFQNRKYGRSKQSFSISEKSA